MVFKDKLELRHVYINISNVNHLKDNTSNGGAHTGIDPKQIKQGG